MSKGYVYILTNEAMPGLLKIGKTTRNVDQRASELTHTGIPFPFDVAESVFSPDCSELERWMHEALADCRVNLQREFFLCGLNKARELLQRNHHEQIWLWMDEFLPDHGFERDEMMIDPAVPSVMSTHVGLHPFEVVDAYAFMMPEDLMPAIKRMRDHKSGAKRMQWLRVADGFEGEFE
jgi:hypothetical protein